MSIVRFEEALDTLRLANPNHPVGLLIPEAIGLVAVGLDGRQQKNHIDIGSDRLHFIFRPDAFYLSVNSEGEHNHSRLPHFHSETKTGPTIVNFSVRNTLAPDSTELHRLIYPARLLTAALGYHRAQTGKPVDRIAAHWVKGSRNYAMYRETLAAHPNRQTTVAKEDAAFTTWTGRQALLHNFGRVFVEDHSYRPMVIRAHFFLTQPTWWQKLFTRG